MGSFLQDLKYGVRTLIKNPGFSVIAIITLALGIGANSAMFSAVNGILLRPLPYKNSNQLVNVWGTSAKYPGFRMTVSTPEFNDVKAQSHSFEDMAQYHNRSMHWTGHGDPEVVSVSRGFAGFFCHPRRLTSYGQGICLRRSDSGQGSSGRLQRRICGARVLAKTQRFSGKQLCWMA